MQLTYAYALQQYDNNGAKDHIFTSEQYASHNNEYENLGNKLKELGFLMMELGLRLARVCDSAVGGQELEQSLLESSAAKGRLIHYHSLYDCRLLNEAAMKNGGKKKMVPRGSYHDAKLSSNIDSNLWQQWHYDYGIFSVLTVPLFMLSSFEQANMEAKDQDLESGYDDECVVSTSGHTYLQIYDPNKKKVFMVKASRESFIIQVGESADIISKGKLRATLHSVGRPADKLESLSRQTFVVFLQPDWNKVFDITDYPINLDSLSEEEKRIAEEDHSHLVEEIQKIVPPLWSRLKHGMSFAEFSKETTKQYYGSSGLQSNR